MTQTVPGPKSLPIIGTAYTINPNDLVTSATKLAEKYGEIVAHDLPGHAPLYLVSSERLVEELSDETRFQKEIHGSLQSIRAFAGNGLFTADQDDPEWDKAHRILMPAFNPVALKGMFEGMADIADQLMLKWARTRPDADVDIADDFTRLTLDTIALTSFSYRFNSFYSEDLHPFVQAMADALFESGRRAHAPDFQTKARIPAQRRFQRDLTTMQETVDGLIAERRQHPSPEGEEDILDVMLSARDSETGERLSDENLRYQLVTFLIAGHETTSGLLSFALYELMKNPEAMRKARAAVDDVVGDRFPEYEDLRQLGYVDQILRETLRLYPPVPGYSVTPRETTTILAGDSHGGIEVHPGDQLFILLNQVHRDPTVWTDPERFDPDRFAFENARHISSSAWKPFGNGMRSCIGRAFALQEAQLVLTLVLQHFDVELADPNYEMKMLDGLTIKPENLNIHLQPRVDKQPYPGRFALRDTDAVKELPLTGGCPVAHEADETQVEPNGQSVQIFVGSNAGTSRSFARRLLGTAKAQGFEASILDLDDAVDNLSTDSPVLICTASYEGLPTDNAKKFVNWLTSDASLDLSDVNYAVMGAGNSEWASTFQRIPTLIDEQLAELGAHRIIERGAADVHGDYVGAFEDWAEDLWPALAELTGVELDTTDAEPGITVTPLDSGRAETLRSESVEGYHVGVVESLEKLSSDADGEINHKFRIDIRLPEGVRYSTGDYLEILPENPRHNVDRVLTRFHQLPDTRVLISGASPFLPMNQAVTISELLGSYVELSTPAGRRHVEALAARTQCPPERDRLLALAQPDTYDKEIQGSRRSVIDLLEEFPSVDLAFGDYLAMLEPLAPRRYSISSSAQRDPELASLTFSHVQGDSWSGRGRYEGVAGSFLSRCTPGSAVTVAVVDGPENFRPESDVTTPMILVGAGTGIAPLRAFLEDMALRAEAEGVQPGKSLLFFGCHGPESDYLYAAELAQWQEAGLVDVRTAFSRHPEEGVDGEVRHVQHRLWQDRQEVVDKLRSGSRLAMCGDAERLAPAVRSTVSRILADADGLTADEADRRVEEMEREHFTYISDVFS